MPFLPGLSPVQGKAVVARFAADEGGQDGVTRRFGVDRRCDRHPRPQLSGERIIRVDGNFDRDALDDLKFPVALCPVATARIAGRWRAPGFRHGRTAGDAWRNLRSPGLILLHMPPTAARLHYAWIIANHDFPQN
jgi:hypothetical protein